MVRHLDCCTYHKLNVIYPIVGKSSHATLRSRREAVIINRLNIGHSRLTHSYLLLGEDRPTCTSCDVLLTVKHILLDCPDLRDSWNPVGTRETWGSANRLSSVWGVDAYAERSIHVRKIRPLLSRMNDAQ